VKRSAEQLDIYARVAGNLRRLLEAVGLQRRAKDVTTPTLDEIAREIEDEKQKDAADV
jgi:cobalamin-dependent methionine synthase I